MAERADAAPIEERGWSLSPARVPAFAGAFAVVIGCLVLLGWAIDSSTLKSGIPGHFEMKANSAICFVLLGVAVWMTSPDVGIGTRFRRTRLAQACALFATTVGALTVIENTLRW